MLTLQLKRFSIRNVINKLTTRCSNESEETMKIGVIGANGNAGSRIVKEGLERGLEVVAIVRGENKSQASKVLQKDLFDLTKEDIKDFDVLVDGFAAWRDEDLPLHTKSLEHLTSILEGTKTRFVIVGGAGCIYLDESHRLQLVDTPDFPKEYYPLAKAMAEGLAFLRTSKYTDWTYVSPAADFDAEGERRGSYQLAGEIFSVNEKGESYISYEDYAIGIIDEVIAGKYIGKRISFFS